ncbi:5-methylcytosine-specific restriction enzyme B [Paraliobacillus sp. PM-2]|uniref:AAA family ATPase n=1 Tax=Paraliobacillus sp. PM-2 TaxID=1462524 RepID=UPI00061C04EB|nr:AAA family ATPase [Paraliobacillus sp. PM-2]CQR46581.1 5-methylcytosine-specific restriction enzyme B [Paraliobacillus sp. PM-2]
MAIYYEQEIDDRKAIYDAAEKWKNECLLNDRSLIWDGESFWNRTNMDRFRAIFVENPDESGNSFDSKFQKQLENESEGVYKFAIELMFIYYIFPYKGSTSFDTKIKKLELIASWKGIKLDTSLPIFQGINQGLGATGTFFNTSKYYEISFLFLIVDYLKKKPLEERKEILNDRIKLKNLTEDVRKKVGKRVQSQHIFLHLILPQKFERIASSGNKEKITKAFSELITDPSVSDLDEKLLIIREKLEEDNADNPIDFYETPSVAKRWRKSEQSTHSNAKKLAKADGPSPVNNSIPAVNFNNVKPFQDGLVFESLELLLNQVMTAISNGKHIILTGPPGTGKSKLASMICDMYNVQAKLVTASSNWSTYETIGGYRPDSESNLYFDEGIFLSCLKNKVTNKPENKWLIIDEINRADIDKAFGSLFSVLTGDEVTLPFQSKSGKSIIMKPQGLTTNYEPNDYTYVIPNDWRIIATMNTIDKASLYEMSYAFMRRFAFIPVGIPKDINNELTQQYLDVWNMSTYPSVEMLTIIWKLINNYRKIGPAIIEDIAKHTQENEDFTSAIILYVLPQFEGLPINRILEFIKQVADQTDVIIDVNYLNDFAIDFFDAGGLE